MARIEFYLGDADCHIAVVDDGAVPREGEMINVRKTTYKVLRVTWAVDDADRSPQLRANVELDNV